ncbi:hypothetical protein TNCV_4428401 [Trichonephila clavipes]|nr:hypothetical protein TNCV_4428401 [Trichonephila clavipes]
MNSSSEGGLGSLVVKVTDSWPACHKFELSTSENPQRRKAILVKSVEAQTYSCGCGVVVRRGRRRLRCHPRHLTMVLNNKVRHQRLSSS